MKKSGILLFVILLSMSLTSCNSEAAEKKTTDEKAVAVKDDNQDQEAVIYLNEADFRKLVWNYQENPQEWVYSGELPAVIDFYAVWCGPCKRVAPIMEKLAKEYKGRVAIYKVDTDQSREVSSVFGIRSIPSVLFIPKNGKPAMQPGAMQEEQYRSIIEEFVLGNKKAADK